MSGGPSQIDTFDPKPGHANGGPFKPIETSVPGILIGEHLPKLAREAKDLAIIRSMSTKEGDHGRATYNLRTGYLPQGPVRYPTLGSLVAKELEDESAELPGFVSIAPVPGDQPRRVRAGLPRPRYAPLIVGERAYGAGRAGSRAFRVDDLELPADIRRERADDRLGLMQSFARDFLETRPGVSPASHKDAYLRAVKMMRSPAAKAFDLDEESAAVRDAYGRNPFGQGCLLARRLVERGVPFVEVTLSGVDGRNSLGWDTHAQNFDAVKSLCGVLDAGWSTLMIDLRSRGLLDDTLIVWMGEFGRTPKINESAGRDHFPNAWSTVLAGGGLKGGQVIGDTGADGERGQRPARLGARLPGHDRQGPGARPDGAEHRGEWPADPARRPEGQADRGGPGMTPSAGLLVLALALARAAVDDAPASAPPAAKFAALGDDAVQDLVILGETRPILLRLRVMIGDRSFRAAWAEGIRAFHARLDGNGDGRLTTEEAEKNGLAVLLNPAGPAAPARGRAEVDVKPEGRRDLRRRADRGPPLDLRSVPSAGRGARGAKDRRPLRSARPRQGRRAHPIRDGGDRRLAPPASTATPTS